MHENSVLFLFCSKSWSLYSSLEVGLMRHSQASQIRVQNHLELSIPSYSPPVWGHPSNLTVSHSLIRSWDLQENSSAWNFIWAVDAESALICHIRFSYGSEETGHQTVSYRPELQILHQEEKLPAPMHTREVSDSTSSKEPTCQCKRCKRHRFDPCQFFFNVDHFNSLYWICYNIALGAFRVLRPQWVVLRI